MRRSWRSSVSFHLRTSQSRVIGIRERERERERERGGIISIISCDLHYDTAYRELNDRYIYIRDANKRANRRAVGHARGHPAMLGRAISRRNNASRGAPGAKLNLRDSWVITYKLHVHRRNNRIIHVVDIRLRFCRAACPRLGKVRAEREVVPPQVARGDIDLSERKGRDGLQEEYASVP